MSPTTTTAAASTSTTNAGADALTPELASAAIGEGEPGHLGVLLRPALVLLAALTVLTGVLYPLVITALAQLTFPAQAAGSLVERDRQLVGSTLIGQAFTEDAYLWGRPSATSPVGYAAQASTGTNLGPSNPALHAAVAERVAAVRVAEATSAPVPADLVTSSGSGLDPHVSPAAARLQVDRIARARGVEVGLVRAVVDAHVEGRTLGLLGAPRVNVVVVNLELDRRWPRRATGPAPP